MTSPITSDKLPPLYKALIPVFVLITLLGINVIWIYKDDSIAGSNQIILILCAALAALIGFTEKFTWEEMEKGVIDGIAATTPAIIILLLIGALSGTWMISGIVPAMIYYGLKMLSPEYFLIATCMICSLVSLATGSSWSTVATVGIALFGVGKALDFSEPLVAGAIISGSYFGDKISPLSDTTNLAPAMAGTTLFRHIEYMLYTTIPSFLFAAIIFFIIGLNSHNTGNSLSIQQALADLEKTFFISPVLFIAPLLVLFLILKKMPALPALLIGMLLGAVFAVIFQPQVIASIASNTNTPFETYYTAIMDAMTVDISIPTDNDLLKRLLVSTGMNGMLGTVWLIIAAMMFGGIMESCNFLKSITYSLLKLVKSDTSLVAATAFTCISTNVLASDQYLSIVVPGRMFKEAFREKGLAPENLSRTLEDAGTVTSVLVPWNTCGAYQAGVLGVPTLAFAPYCFFNIISPVMTVLFSLFKIRIARLDPQLETKTA